MWVLLGPFDGEVSGDSGFQKPKLLKPDTSYTLGRKDTALHVNNKKISHDHCNFVVGPHSVEDVSNPSLRPTLKIINRSKKDKSLLISRNDEEVHAYPSSEELLLEEDVVTLITGVHVTVKWVPICAYTTPSIFKAEECASLGMKLVHTPHAEVTHHITTDYTADLLCSVSLLSLCHFVKPEWLQEVIRLGMLPRGVDSSNGTSLEDHFMLPLENKYRPDFGANLLPAQKTLNIWVPNEERVNLFRTCRFICLYEKMTAKETELREVLHRGGGLLENFDIHSGIQKFRQALTRSQSKEGKKTLVVGDFDSMQLAIGETWADFMSEARSTSVPVLPPSKVIQAIMDANVEVLFEANDAEQDNGPSMSSPLRTSRPRLVRRVNSGPASREASVDTGSVIQEQDPAVPRKALTRSTKLKRRFGLTKEMKETHTLSSIVETVREPPLKRFKALFEATNAESMDLESTSPMDDPIDAAASGMTQTQAGAVARSLDGVDWREEEEETQNFVAETPLQRGKKRRLLSEDVVEFQIIDEDRGSTTADVAEPSNKRRAVENFNSIPPVVFNSDEIVRSGSKSPSNVGIVKTSGAPVGKPDTDDAFLKAIASTKRGKKNEDEFDREFNKLKITKPELDRHEPEEVWNVLADFGEDSGLRGNFMVIVEIDPYKRDGCHVGSTGLKEKPANREWNQQPNFKKFNKKNIRVQRTKIELFASQTENDYGVVDSYWTNGQSQNIAGTQRRLHGSQEELPLDQSQSLWQEDTQTQVSRDAVVELPRRSNSRKPSSGAGFAAPLRSSRQKTKVKADPLFLQSYDEDAVREDETLLSGSEERQKPPVPKRAVKKPPSRSRKQPVVMVDDDSDEAVFQGFKAKT